MMSRPSQENLLVSSQYDNVSFDVREGMSGREPIVKASVGWGRLRREEQMEEIRMRSLEMVYDKGLESSQMFSFDTLQLADFASMYGEVCDEIWSEDANSQLHATTLIEKLLSVERECATTLVNNGFVRRFVHFVMKGNFFDLQYEAAWALIKIFLGSSGRTRADVVHEAVPCFTKLLDSSSDDVCEMAVFALGIVVDNSPEYCDLVISNGVLVPLFKQLEKNANLGKHAKLSMLRNVTWTLSLLCDEDISIPNKQLKPALRTLERLLDSDDMEVLINSCWAIHSIACDGFGKIRAIMNAGICPKLVKHLTHSSHMVQIPVLMTVPFIFLDMSYVQTFIKNGVLGHLLTLLTEDHKDDDRKIKPKACRVISDILGGYEWQIQAVIDSKLFGPLVKLLESPDKDLQAAAAKAIKKATSCGSRKQIEYLVNEYNIINHIPNLLSSPKPITVKYGLEILENVLVSGLTPLCPPNPNPYTKLIVEAQCVEEINKIWIKVQAGVQIDDDTTTPSQVFYILQLLGLKRGLGLGRDDGDDEEDDGMRIEYIECYSDVEFSE